jgi:cytochrome c oxidase assembly protein subunit 15
MSRIILGVVTLQIVYGAFVAGLKAGHVYNTFPKMGDTWFPEAITAMNPTYVNFTEGLAGVQFIHRYIAYTIVALFIILWYRTKGLVLNEYQQPGIKILGLVLGVQFLLGVFTLLYAVPITLGVLHQVGAFFLFASAIYLVFHSRSASVR